MLNNLLVKSLSLLIYFLLVNVNTSTAKENEVFETPKKLNTYGMPGSIDTPTAEVFPEGQFSVSSSIFGGTINTKSINKKQIMTFFRKCVGAILIEF